MHRSTRTLNAIQDRRLIEGEAEETITTCDHDGCGQATTGGKPFCLDHLDRMPYVTGLRLTLLRQARAESGRTRRRSVA